MGLLFNYLRLIARGGRQASRRAPSSPRRRLAFERCESRIALSTNDVTSGSDAILHSDAADDKSSLLQLRSDNGMIAVSFMATDVTSWRETTTSSFVVDQLNVGKLVSGQLVAHQLDAGRFNADRLDAIKPLDPVNFAIRNDAMSLLTNSIAHDVLGGNVDLKDVGGLDKQGWSKPDDFNLFDSTSGGDYAMPLNDTELASGSANSDFAVIPPPTEPSGLNGGSEGGQIALSPFVAPTGLTLSDGQGSSSIVRVGPANEPLGANAAPTANGATRAEGLRGRAVVYEVADAETSAAARAARRLADGGEPSAEEINGELDLAAQATFNEGAATVAKRQVATRAANMLPGEDEPTDAAIDGRVDALLAELDLNDPVAFAALSADFNPSFNGANVAGRDAAFADWLASDAQEQAGPQDELTAPTAASDRRMLGVGVAMALTVLPLRKAWRRRGATPIERQLSPERRSARHDG